MTTKKENKAPAYTRKTALTVPTLSTRGLKAGDSIFVQIVADFEKKVETNRDGTTKLKDDGSASELNIARVINLRTAEELQLVVPAIPYRAFVEFAGGEVNINNLVGKSFELCRGESLGTGKANLWSVYELDV